EAPALSLREAPMPGVPADLAAVLIDDRAFARSEPVPLEEGAVVVTGEEARLLALAPPRDGEPGALRLGARLRLCVLAEREDDPVELCRIEPREHVRLVLLPIGSAREQPAPAVLDDARVVARREHVGARTAREREQATEAKRTVATHARIRGLTA